MFSSIANPNPTHAADISAARSSRAFTRNGNSGKKQISFDSSSRTPTPARKNRTPPISSSLSTIRHRCCCQSSRNAVGQMLSTPRATAATGAAVLELLERLNAESGVALVMVTHDAEVAARARRDRRGSALGVQQSAGGLARVVGPTAGGLLFQHVGLSAPSLAGAALAAGAALLTVPARSGGGTGGPQRPVRPRAGVDAPQASGAPTP